MRSEQKLGFEGHLDRDTDPSKMDTRNYSDCKNVNFITDNTESTRGYVPMKGNVSAFDLGSVAVQNKTWRVFTQNLVTANAKVSFFLYDQNGNILPTINGQVEPVVIGRTAQTIVQQASILLTALTTIFGGGNVTAVATTTDATPNAEVGYIDITISSIPGYDWGLIVTAAISVGSPLITDPLLKIEIVKEAFDLTLTGELHTIGSYDLLGDLYVWSTPQINLPTIISATISNIIYTTSGVTSPVTHQYQVTANGHGLVNGMNVAISGVVSSAPVVAPDISPNGQWIVKVKDANNFYLTEWYDTNTGGTFAYASGGSITLYSLGIGEVGVGQYDAPTDVWTYTRLGRTKQWGFRTKKQIDTYCERTAIKDSVYWTDDYNTPRNFYYIKEYDANGNLLPFNQDGIIKTLHSGSGLYTYTNIQLDTRLQLISSGTSLTFLQQLQAGGQVPSGNWRYAVRLLSNSLLATVPSDLTNPINVYLAADNGSPVLVVGDAPNTITPKINQLQIDNILPGLFKYIELIGVNYVGNSVVGYVISRTLLTDTQTSITLNHTGTETGTTNFDLGLLNQQFEAIVTAKNIDVIDKRMILSNLTTQQRIDFTSWAQSLTYTIERKQLTAVRSAVHGTLVVGEYQDPNNVNRYLGYMHNETYRFGVKGRLKQTGIWTDVFLVDDITINLTSAGRKTSHLTTFDLTKNTSGGADNILFSAYINFVINAAALDYLVGGIKVRDLFDAISFVRAEVTNPTILACGVGILGLSAGATTPGTHDETAGNGGFWSIDPDNTFSNMSNPNYIIEYPFASGRTFSGDVIGGNPTYPTAVPSNGLGNWTQRRRYAAFYSPDILFNKTSILFEAGDVILNYGNPQNYIFNNTYSSNATKAYSNYAEYTGITNISAPPTSVTLSHAPVVTEGGSFVNGADIFTKKTPVEEQAGPVIGYANNPEGIVLNSTSNFTTPIAAIDYGIYYMQYYRALTNQYGDPSLTQYVSCGHLLEITSSYNGGNESVFGGDTFTQANYFRHRNADSILNGLGGGIFFYCQNRVNAQMKSPSIFGASVYPNLPTTTWLERPIDDNDDYNDGYTARNEVQSNIAFNPNLEDASDLPARITWSDIKPQGSPSDGYRNYLPLNFHDLDQSFGEIVHHANSNGELVTWQQRAFMRQYFNTRGTLEVGSITEILIGDGTVMSRDGVTVSRLGCKHKWAIIKGKSQGGNDTFYWINTELKKALRFGYDGTISIADVKDMQSFLANNLTWVNNYDTPADGAGICGVWDDRYSNAIWTINGSNPTVVINNWDVLASYSSNALVFYPSDPFMGKQNLYISKIPTLGNQPDISPVYWKKLPNDGTYYNKYTLVFNEFKNAFIKFDTPTPKIYLKWTDTYLSPRPISPEYKIYQHNKGAYLTWYLNSGVSQQEQGYIEGVVNGTLQRIEDEIKWFEAIGANTLIVPKRVEFKNTDQQSYLIDTEFEGRERNFYSPIKEDSTTTGLNDQNTSLLYDTFLKVKMFFDINIYQELKNITVKYRISPRTKNK